MSPLFLSLLTSMIPLEFFRWNFSFYSSFFLIREVKFVVVVVVVIVVHGGGSFKEKRD